MNPLTGALKRFLDLFRPTGCTNLPATDPAGSPVGIPLTEPEPVAVAEVVGQAAIATTWNQNRATITALAWTIRHDPADPVSVHTLSCDESTQAAQAGLILEAVQAILQQAEIDQIRVELFLDDRTVLAELFNTAPAFPRLILRPLWVKNRTAVKAAVRALPTPPRLVIATDASIVPNKPGAGIAVVTADGQVTTRYLPTETQILLAELEAIALALATHRTCPLQICSDSTIAVALVNSHDPNVHGQLGNVLHRIDTLRHGRDTQISWVKGHNGDPLNEAADHHANLTRRHAKTQPTAVIAPTAA